MSRIPATVPPLPRDKTLDRRLAGTVAFTWLAAGWKDLMTRPVPSLLYGLVVFLVSTAVVSGLFALDWDYILFPALAGFMVIGPLLAVGLYEKSRRIEHSEPATLAGMIFVRARSGGQILFIGVILCGLMLLWMRTAVILYALFFGLQPFPGLDKIAPMLVTTPIGWSMLFVGSLVGGLFAAFSFAISALSIPMLLDQRLDAFTAMGRSMALVWNNLPVMLTWGAIVVVLIVVGLVPALLGLIVVFPLLGHATWHAYKALR
jgi:uncharacterized membrane protein